MLDTTLSVKVYQRLPGRGELASIDEISPALTSVEVETQLNGGFGVCRLGMGEPDQESGIYPHLPVPVSVMDGARVVVKAGNFLLHEGVLQSTEEPGGKVVALSSLGYGLAAGNWKDFENAQAVEATQGNIVRASAALLPWIDIARVCSTAETIHHPWNGFDKRSVAQVLEQLTREGNDSSQMFYWTVYDDRKLIFICKMPPSEPHYRLSLDDRIRPQRNYADVYDRARARYGNEGAVTGWFYAAGVDRTSSYLREKTLDAGDLSASDAAQFAQTWIATYGAPQLSATLTLKAWDTVQAATGVAVHGYMLRAGQWIELEGYGMAQITQTRCNFMTGDVEVQIGQPAPETTGYYWQRLLESAEATRAGLSPLSWGRR